MLVLSSSRFWEGAFPRALHSAFDHELGSGGTAHDSRNYPEGYIISADRDFS